MDLKLFKNSKIILTTEMIMGASAVSCVIPNLG